MENPTSSLSLEDRADLVRPVSLEEVLVVVMTMSPFKAPAADGFHAFFYKQYWHIQGHELHHMVEQAF